jgi:hypothetical protein
LGVDDGLVGLCAIGRCVGTLNTVNSGGAGFGAGVAGVNVFVFFNSPVAFFNAFFFIGFSFFTGVDSTSTFTSFCFGAFLATSFLAGFEAFFTAAFFTTFLAFFGAVFLAGLVAFFFAVAFFATFLAGLVAFFAVFLTAAFFTTFFFAFLGAAFLAGLAAFFLLTGFAFFVDFFAAFADFFFAAIIPSDFFNRRKIKVPALKQKIFLMLYYNLNNNVFWFASIGLLQLKIVLQ